MKDLLFVEGASDKQFFRALLQHWGVSGVDLESPADHGKKDTVSFFPSLLPTLLKRQENGRLRHLGIIADADTRDGGGFDLCWKTFTTIFAEFKFKVPTKPPKNPNHGSLFRSEDLPDVGLWLMPHHQGNGILEELLWTSLTPDQAPLKNYASKVIASLPERRFGELQLPKAHLYSLLAWQKRPGLSLDVLVNSGILDMESAPMKGFKQWLAKVFPEHFA